MTPSLIGIDPSDMIADLLTAGLPHAAVGWDMPPGGGPRVFLTLSPGAMPTPVTQRMTLTLSCYASQPDGSCDWRTARTLFADAVRRLLAACRTYPIVDAAVQSGPIRQHDTALHTDYAYGAVLLTVAAR
ncbi:hypothetical protein [Bifidobacterium samirii]|uniref:Uncharacterized protein n=1 Tax=Bifidobacterium samirii TaxID=2306974 RepID=A0A430FJL8_9BIFI|nr:hypothetical protein [Bifidobacterium samirii]RSX53026.1 hypothetical protein D2E24_1697 [Bifidobacterium samirii]